MKFRLAKEFSEEQDLIIETQKKSRWNPILLIFNRPWFLVVLFGTIAVLCLATIILSYFGDSGLKNLSN